MQISNVSEPICSTTNGWFRYNYDENRLEFLNHNTKLVVQVWSIPADQWEALPSQKEYCENIVREAENQAVTNQKSRSHLLTISVIMAIIAVVCFLFIGKEKDVFSIRSLVVFSVAVPIGCGALSKILHR